MYQRLNLNDYGILRKYTDNKYKVTCMNFYRQDGFDSTPRKYTAKGEAGNYAKLVNNMSRTRSRIYELSICNNWEWYVTFTLDSSKYDRSNLKQFIKDLSQFIRDYRKKTNNQVKYLLIPEKHKDGSWHMHGLLMEIPNLLKKLKMPRLVLLLMSIIYCQKDYTII